MTTTENAIAMTALVLLNLSPEEIVIVSLVYLVLVVLLTTVIWYWTYYWEV